MRKCEVITGDNVFQVKDRINQWLTYHEGAEILFFSCEKIYNQWHAAYIIYDDSPPIPPIPDWASTYKSKSC